MEEDTGVTAVPAVPEHASTADVTSPTVVTMDSADADAGADADATVAGVPDGEEVLIPELFSSLESQAVVPKVLANMARSGVHFSASPREIWSHSPDSCGVSAFLAFWSVNQTITLYFP